METEIATVQIEEKVLNAMLYDADTIQIAKSQGLNESDFTGNFRKQVFKRIFEYGDIDIVMLLQSIPEHEPALIDLQQRAEYFIGKDIRPYFEAWCKEVKEYSAKRKIVTETQKLIHLANDSKAEFKTGLDTVIADILKEKNRLEVRKTVSEAEEFEQYCKPQSEENEVVEYGLGFDDIIRHSKGTCFILAGLAGSGKTSLVTSAILNMIRQGKRVALFCEEMKASELYARLESNLANIPLGNVMYGKQRDTDAEAVIAKAIAKKRLFIRTGASYKHSAEGIASELDRICAEAGTLDFCAVDYIQNLKEDQKTSCERERIDIALARLKEVAIDRNIAMMLLSQVNRDGEKMQNLSMANLKGSTLIDQIATVVAILASDEKTPYNQIGMIVCKNRNGQVGKRTLQFERQYTRFSALEHTISRDDIPKYSR